MRKRVKQHVRRLAQAVMPLIGPLLLCATDAHAATFTWTGLGANDFWNTSANWQGGTPASNSLTELTFAGSTRLTPFQNFSPSFQLRRLNFASGAGAFTLGGNELAFTGDLVGISQNSSVKQTITNSVSTPGGLFISGTGTGTVEMAGTISGFLVYKAGDYPLDITAPISSTHFQVLNGSTQFLPGAAPQFGQLLVSGSASQLALRTGGDFSIGGDGRSQTMTVSSAGRVTSDNTFLVGRGHLANGTVLISGAGASLSTGGSGMLVGFEGNGSGTVIVSNGGNLSTNLAELAGFAGNRALVSVGGPGATWNNLGNQLVIGQAGSASLNVFAGGQVNSQFAVIGAQSGSNGTVNISGTGTTWTNPGNFINVGSNGSATLSIGAGAQVTSGSSTIGDGTGSAGTVLIDGAGSSWVLDSPGSYVDLNIGQFGAATLSISNGGLLSVPVYGTTSLGRGATTSSGYVMVSGAGSMLNLPEQDFGVGDVGAGTMNVMDGGVVVSKHGSVAKNSATGVANVSGAGSLWQMSQGLRVGGGASGTLNIDAGGVVRSQYLTLGDETAGAGRVVVSGAASRLTGPAEGQAISLLNVGNMGHGTLIVAGGLVDAGFLSAGFGSNAFGVIEVSSGTLSVRSSLFLTELSTMQISGGLVDTTSIVSYGTTTLSGGTLRFNEPQDANAFASVLNLSGGTMLIDGGSLFLYGQTNWSGGAVAGAGTGQFVNESFARLTVDTSAASSKTLSRNLINKGTVTINTGNGFLGAPLHLSAGVTFTNNGTFVVNGDATLHEAISCPDIGTATLENLAGRNFTVATSAGGSTYFGNQMVLNNAGNFITTGAGTAIYGGTIQNTGSVSISSGTLHLAGGGTLGGSLSVASGAALMLGGFTVGPATLIDIAPGSTIGFRGGATSINVPWSPGVTTVVDGGAIAQFNDSFNGQLQVSNATAVFAGNATLTGNSSISGFGAIDVQANQLNLLGNLSMGSFAHIGSSSVGTIDLGGTNRTINLIGGESSVQGVRFRNGDLSITGIGNIQLKGTDLSGGLTIDGGSVIAEKSGSDYAITGHITLVLGYLTIKSVSENDPTGGISPESEVTVLGGKVLSQEGDAGVSVPTGTFVLGNMTLAGGATEIDSGSTGKVLNLLSVSGGINTIERGAASLLPFLPPSAPGILTVGGIGLRLTGNANSGITIQSGEGPGRLNLNGNLLFDGSAGTSFIAATVPLANEIPGFIDLGGAVRTVTTNNGTGATDVLISAQITNGGITKSGAGTLRLASSNTYAGGTTLSNGTLEATHPHAMGTGSVIFNGGTLAVKSDSSLTSIANALHAAPANSIRINIDRLTPGPVGVVSVGPATFGSTLLATGAGTLLIAGGTLGSNLVLENFVPLTIDGALTGNFGVDRGGSELSTAGVTLSGATGNTYTGLTRVNRGTLALAKSSGAAIPADLSVVGGAVVWLGSHQIVDSAVVTVSGGARLDVGGATEKIAALVNSGSVNLNGILIVDNGENSPFATMRAQLATAYANGTWAGPGIGSSAAASIAGDAMQFHKTALGYAQAAALNVGSFAGQQVSTQAVLIRYTYSGDANLDGLIDTSDFTALSSHFNQTSQFWTSGDFNFDGIVNALDFNALATNFGLTLPAPELSAPLASLVPEPALCIPLAIGMVMRRRDRRAFWRA